MKNIPKAIFLQICENTDDLPDDFNELSVHDITWCADNLGMNDIEYRLATSDSTAKFKKTEELLWNVVKSNGDCSNSLLNEINNYFKRSAEV